jgi:16S rRNA (guanine966-N2)-methyltransferase
VAVHRGDALSWMRANTGAFDIAFVDPPFAAALWEQVIAQLPALLAADAWLYLESPAGVVPALPAEWRLHREGATRDVRYALYRRGTLDAVPSSGDQQTT